MSTSTSILLPNEWFTQLNTLIEVLEHSIRQENIRKLRTYKLDTLIKTVQHELPAPSIAESASAILSVVYRARIAKQLIALQKLINSQPRFFIPYCSSLYLRQKTNQLCLLKTLLANLKDALQRLKPLLRDELTQNNIQEVLTQKQAKKRKSRTPGR